MLSQHHTGPINSGGFVAMHYSRTGGTKHDLLSFNDG